MKCPYSEFFWSAFSRICTEYGEILGISPYPVRMRENTDQKNSEYRHFFSRCVSLQTSLHLLTPQGHLRHIFYVFSCFWINYINSRISRPHHAETIVIQVLEFVDQKNSVTGSSFSLNVTVTLLQQTFTCSNSTIQTLGKSARYVQS